MVGDAPPRGRRADPRPAQGPVRAARRHAMARRRHLHRRRPADGQRAAHPDRSGLRRELRQSCRLHAPRDRRGPRSRRRSPTRWPASPANRPNGTPPGPKNRNKERRHELCSGLRDPGAGGQQAGLYRHGDEGRADVRRVRRDCARSNAGARTFPTASAPTSPRGRGGSRREDRLLLGLVARQGDLRRGRRKRCMADERMQPRRRHAVRRQTHDLSPDSSRVSTAATAANSARSTGSSAPVARTTSSRRSATMRASWKASSSRRRAAHRRRLGNGRARRQHHRFQACGRCGRPGETGRRSAGSNGPTRRRTTLAGAGADGRIPTCSAIKPVVRRAARDLRRVRADPRHRSRLDTADIGERRCPIPKGRRSGTS